jgi:hypothetical protein
MLSSSYFNFLRIIVANSGSILIMKLLFLMMFSYRVITTSIEPNYTSPARLEIYNPPFFSPTGPWSLMSKAGNTLYITGEELAIDCVLL